MKGVCAYETPRIQCIFMGSGAREFIRVLAAVRLGLTMLSVTRVSLYYASPSNILAMPVGEKGGENGEREEKGK